MLQQGDHPEFLHLKIGREITGLDLWPPYQIHLHLGRNWNIDFLFSFLWQRTNLSRFSPNRHSFYIEWKRFDRDSSLRMQLAFGFFFSPQVDLVTLPLE